MGCGCNERRTELGKAAQAIRAADYARTAEHLRNVRESARLDAQRLARTAFQRIDSLSFHSARRSD